MATAPFWGGYSENQGNRPGWQRIVDRVIPGNLNQYRDTFGSNRTAQDRLAGATGILAGQGGLSPLGLLARLANRYASRAQAQTPEFQFRQLSEEDRAALGLQDETDYRNWQANRAPDHVRNIGGLGINLPGYGYSGNNTAIMPSIRPTVTVGPINSGGIDTGGVTIDPVTGVVSYPNGPTSSDGPAPSDETPTVPRINSTSTPSGTRNLFNLGGSVGGGSAATYTNAGSWRTYGGLGSMNPSAGQQLDPRWLPG